MDWISKSFGSLNLVFVAKMRILASRLAKLYSRDLKGNIGSDVKLISSPQAIFVVVSGLEDQEESDI